jgi:hypothetical protein
MRRIASQGSSLNLWIPLAALAIIFIFAVPRGAQAVSFGYFLRFHGITYSGTRFEEGRLLTPDDLGAEVGRVVCDVVDLYSPASGSMGPSAASTEGMQKCAERDGGASMLRPGTAIYSIRGYRPEYRLAVNTGHQWMIFHASENARATVGADMSDLETKVDAVTLRLEDYLAPRNRPGSSAYVGTGSGSALTKNPVVCCPRSTQNSQGTSVYLRELFGLRRVVAWGDCVGRHRVGRCQPGSSGDSGRRM